jgi:YbbR domain-containing protein
MPALNRPIPQATAKLRMIRSADLRHHYSPAALRRRLRRNMGLRVISVLLAIGLWVFVNAVQPGSVQTFHVPVNYRGLPPGFIITNQHPGSVTIQVTGPRTLLSIIDPDRLTLKIDLNGVGVGQASFKVVPEAFPVPRKTNVESISPSQIVLDVDKIIAREAPVHLALTGKVADGYKITQTEIVPNAVRLRGPSKELAQIERVETEAFDVAGLSAEASRDLPLVAPGGMVRVNPTQVTARVVLAEVIGDREYRRLPVQVRDSGYRFNVIPQRINLTVRGPRLKLGKLDLRGAVYVEADGMPPGYYDMPVQVTLPDGVELVRQTPEKVRLRMFHGKKAANG